MRNLQVTDRLTLGPLRAASLLLCLLWVVASGSARGQTMSGSANVTFVSEDRRTTRFDTMQVNGVDSLILDTVDIERNAVTQEYAASWMRHITPWVITRANVRYYHTGSEQTAINDIWRQEFQPSAEISWNHPIFHLIGTVQRRESKGTAELSDIIRESITARWQSRVTDWPLMQISYAFEHTYNDTDPGFEEVRQDARNHWLEGRIEYDYRDHSLTYAVTRRWLDAESGQLALDPINQATILRQSNVESTEWNQLLRWLQSSYHFDKQLRVSSSYTLRHHVVDTRRSGVLRGVSARAALYANDLTPDQGILSVEAGLSDGDTRNATTPVIDIGTGETGHNFGLDFGIEQDINAIYVYTNRPSGEQVMWHVYTSSDNLTWSESSVNVVSIFSLTENRYEIVFPTVRARYVKVVIAGFNRFDAVFVTEVEAFLQADDIEDDQVDNVSHALDIANTYTATDELELTADFNFVREPGGSFDQTRQEYYFGLGAEYEPSAQFLHTLRAQRGLQHFSIGDQDQSNTTLSYSMLYTPLDRLQFTLAGASIHSYLEDERVQESNNLIWEATGTPFRTINMAVSVSYARNNRFRFGDSFASWTYRGSLDGQLSRALTGIVSVSQQRLTNRTDDSLRIRNQYTAGLDFRLSRNIFTSADVSLLDDDRNVLRQEYTASWNLSSRLTIGGLASLSDDGDGFRTEQLDGRINLRIRNRAGLNAGVTRTKITGIGGFESTSFRVGFRSGF